MQEDFFSKELNEQQLVAVRYTGGPELIIAGAGSGKTRVLTYKVAYLLQQGVRASRILALTFTNKAAREMKERIIALVGTEAKYLYMGTFHSICARLLRGEAQKLGYNSNFTIYDTSSSENVIKNICKQMLLDSKVYNPRTIASLISTAKNRQCDAAQYARSAEWRQRDNALKMPLMPDIYWRYEQELKFNNAMDFDDLLMNMNILLQQDKEARERLQKQFTHVLVDEYQDTNYAQFLLVKQLAFPQDNICVVGDDAQSIYAFRGADINNILSFQRIFGGELFKLERNYRSTQTIVSAANSLIAHNHNQIQKSIFSQEAQGEKVEVDTYLIDKQENKGVAMKIYMQHSRHSAAYSDFAVLYRKNSLSRGLEEELRRLSIPYRVFGGLSFYDRKEVRDAIAYFRLVVNSNDNEALLRIINTPARGIGATTEQKIIEQANRSQKSLFYIISHAMDYSFSAKTTGALLAFASLVQSWRDQLDVCDAFELGRQIVEESTLMASLQADRTVEGKDRVENVHELLGSLETFVAEHRDDGGAMLPNFMEEVSLLTDADISVNPNEQGVTLMTIHSAKGLEFENVFIVGLEEGIFPSYYCVSEQEIEEERRLMYVAMTRAKKHLTISFAKNRFFVGQTMNNKPSRFLQEIGRQYLDFSTEKTVIAPPKKTVIPLEINELEEREELETEWKTGERVRHKTFGEGEVVATYRENMNPKIEIIFDEGGKKTLLLTFAKLEHIK